MSSGISRSENGGLRRFKATPPNCRQLREMIKMIEFNRCSVRVLFGVDRSQRDRCVIEYITISVEHAQFCVFVISVMNPTI